MHTFSKLYHADFVFPSKGQTSVVLSSIFLPQSSAKHLFHDTSGGTFRIIIAYQDRNPSLLVLKIFGKANFLKMLIDVDHDNLRTVLLQTPNTSHSFPF